MRRALLYIAATLLSVCLTVLTLKLLGPEPEWLALKFLVALILVGWLVATWAAVTWVLKRWLKN